MISFILQVTDYGQYFPSISTLLGFITVGLIMWGAAKKFTSLTSEVNSLKNDHDEDILELKEKLNEFLTTTREKITSVESQTAKEVAIGKVERKEEITKAIINQHERIEVLQKQIDATKSDVKDMASRITVVDTKAKHFEVELNRLCDDIDKLKSFFADWIQRVEDRIKESNNYIFKIISKRLEDDENN